MTHLPTLPDFVSLFLTFSRPLKKTHLIHDFSTFSLPVGTLILLFGLGEGHHEQQRRNNEIFFQKIKQWKINMYLNIVKYIIYPSASSINFYFSCFAFPFILCSSIFSVGRMSDHFILIDILPPPPPPSDPPPPQGLYFRLKHPC